MSVEKITTSLRDALGDDYNVTVRTGEGGAYFGEAAHTDGGTVSFAITAPGAPQEARAHILVSQKDAPGSAMTTVEATLYQIERELYEVTEESLDAMSDHTLVQVVERTAFRPGGKPHETYSYFEKYGRGWMELDPSDRDDGENTHPSAYIISKSKHFGMKSDHYLPGSVRVVFAPAP